MTRKKLLIFGCCLLAFGTYAVLTGGVVVGSFNDFSGQRNIQLVAGLRSDVYLEPRQSKFGIPFVFHYFGTAKPFDLRLQIWDEQKQYASIEITKVVVEYGDGDRLERIEPWSRELRPYTQHNYNSTGLVKTEMLMLSDHVKALVSRHVDAKVTLIGTLVKVNGERVDFRTSELFKAKSRSEVTTFWEALAGC